MMRRMARFLLSTLLGLMGMSAVAGGAGVISGLIHFPHQWLDGSPFDSYVIPGIVLLFVVGVGSLLASYDALFSSPIFGDGVSILMGSIIVGWILVEILTIGLVNWMQPVVLGLGIAILLLALALWHLDYPGVRSRRGGRPGGRFASTHTFSRARGKA